MNVRSTHAVVRPAAIPQAKNGSSGTTSLFHSRRPRFHQKTTSKAAGNVAVTDLLKSASRNSPKLRTYDRARRFESKCKYASAEARYSTPDSVFLSSVIQATDST